MTLQLRSFLAGSKPGLVLQGIAHLERTPHYWVGQPDARLRRRQVVAIWLLAAALAVHLALQHAPAAFFLVPTAMALLVPLLYAYDWYETEYLVGPRTILVKPGLFQRSINTCGTLDYNACRLVQGRLLQRWTGCCNLVLYSQGEDVNRVPLVLRDLDLKQAGLLLDALQTNDPDQAPEDLVRLHRQRHGAAVL
jgi:hypothetical protein